jgi:hypothetical protein
VFSGMTHNQGNSIPHGEDVDAVGLVKKGVVAKAASCSLRTIDNLQHRGLIPYIKLSPRCVRYHLPSVLAALRKFEIREVN